MKAKRLFAAVMILLNSASAGASTQGRVLLSLDDYLHQVREQNSGVRASEKMSLGALQRSAEADLAFALTPFAEANLLRDSSEKSQPDFQGTQSTLNSYSMGVRKMTRFGLQASVSYAMNYSAIAGANPTFLPDSSYYNTGLTLELTQPLWRNGFGREVRAVESMLRAQAMAKSYAEKFAVKATLAEAESVYWGLSLARELVRLAEENLSRSEKIRSWNASRARMELTDRSDVLQSEAAVLARKLELRSAQDEMDAASRRFNTLRGVDSKEVSEVLSEVTEETLSEIQIPDRKGDREDVQAAEAQVEAQIASAKTGIEKSKPTLDLFVSGSLTGRDALANSAIPESFSTDFPSHAVGVRFAMPFDLAGLFGDGIAASMRKGYQAEVDGAELALLQTRFAADREWKDLVARFVDAKERLSLTREMEQAQKKKMLHERTLHNRGRSTTYQVLLFEQELANAQLARIRNQTEVLSLYSQLKMFGGEK